MESEEKQVFADAISFDFIYHAEKKWENSNRGQKMSGKIYQKFLNCDFTLSKAQSVNKVTSVSPKKLPRTKYIARFFIYFLYFSEIGHKFKSSSSQSNQHSNAQSC